MNAREKLSIILLLTGLLLALLPSTGQYSFSAKPDDLLSASLDQDRYLNVDQVARFVASQDPSVQLIDLRPSDEFKEINIPGALNIPYRELTGKNPESILTNKTVKYVFYSNGDIDASYAIIMAMGSSVKNTFIMKGGLNEWFNIVMNSEFKGEKITPRENAIFEARTKAKRLFTEFNSLPDSIKVRFAESKRTAAKKLDGGCE